MAKTKHGLPETRGSFKLRGIATGLNRDGALKQHTYDSGSQRNTLNFGVKTSEDSTVYVTVDGFKNKDAYLFKRSEKKGQPGDKKVVPWDNRYDYEEEGFKVIGVQVGLEQDDKGSNIINTLVDYDAADEIKKSLQDDTPVFVRGNLEFSSFKTREGDVRRSQKFVANNVYLSKSVNFDDDSFKETSDFKQKIIFTGIQKHDSEEKFIIEAKIATRDSIENTEFIIYNKSLANQFRKLLKPYTAIDVWGHIQNKLDAEDLEEQQSAVWGEEDTFKRINRNYIRELVVTGADPQTIDTETYSQQEIEEAIKKLNSQGQIDDTSSNPWGETTNDLEVNDDDLPW